MNGTSNSSNSTIHSNNHASATASIEEEMDPEEEQKAEILREILQIEEQLVIEQKVKQGAENMLKVYYTFHKSESIAKDEVDAQLRNAEIKIEALNTRLNQLKNSPALKGRALKISRHQRLEVTPLRVRSTSGINTPTDVEESPLKRSLPAGYPSAKSQLSTVDTSGLVAILNDGVNYLKREKKERQPQATLDTLAKMASTLKSLQNTNTPIDRAQIIAAVRKLFGEPIKEIRASAFRTLRYTVSDAASVELLMKMQIDFFVARSLIRDPRMEVEREQALKFIRGCMNAPGGAKHLTRELCGAIITVAEATEDKMRNICLETLCELSLANIELVSHCGGLSILFHALLDASSDQTNSLVLTLLTLLDREETRCYIRPDVDMEMVFSPFTDPERKSTNAEARLQASAQAIILLLKSWTGILYLLATDKHAIRALVEALILPFEEVRKTMLEMFFEIFRLKVPIWTADFVAALRRTVDSQNSDDAEYEAERLVKIKGRQDLVNNYLSVVLLAFLKAGLLSSLIEIMKDSNKHLAVRATILLGEVLNLVNKLLPASYAPSTQALPSLFEIGATFTDEIVRNHATSAISHLEKMHRARDQLHPMDSTGKWFSYKSHSNSESHGLTSARQERIRKHIQDVKLRLGLQIDDNTFNNMVRDTLVLTEKSFSKWNWDLINELLQGPLMSSKRLEDSINNKFLRRLMTFYHPSSHQFSTAPRNQEGIIFVRVGCQLIETLLATLEGCKFLGENDLLPQIQSGLEELDPMCSQKSDDPLFSPERMKTTLSRHYFSLLGVLTTCPQGITLMKKFRFFTLFYFLTELRSRDDIIKSIISSMDYNSPGHTRTLLSKVMTSASKNVRLFATDYARLLSRSSTRHFNQWGIRLLNIQAYDPVSQVCEKALIVLEEACNTSENLETLVKLRPSYDHLGEIGTPLQLKIMSRPSGFEYLREINFIDQQLQFWEHGHGNEIYVQQIELSLSRALASYVNNPSSVSVLVYRSGTAAQSSTTSSSSQASNPTTQVKSSQLPVIVKETDGTLLPHFFGELVKTTQGCALLEKTGSFKNMLKIIQDCDPNKPTMTTEEILRVKGALWAIGHIGACPLGLPFLEKENAIADIINLAENSNVLSIRGTAFYVLSLISQSSVGGELLEEHGWESVMDKSGNGGIAVPMDISKIFNIRSAPFKGYWPEEYDPMDSLPDDPIIVEIMEYASNLSNAIVAIAASKSLTKLKKDHPMYFANLELLLDVLKVVNMYRYKLNACRFVMDLFDKVVFDDAAMEVIAKSKNQKEFLFKGLNQGNGPTVAQKDDTGKSTTLDKESVFLPPKVVIKGFDMHS